MGAYRSCGIVIALALLAACSSGMPHPQSWRRGSDRTWTTSAGGGQWYRYSSHPTQGSLSDLASAQAVNTVERYHGAKLLGSAPFRACPGEAGLATYALPGERILEVAFSVYSGTAVLAEYERHASAEDAPEVMSAFQQAVCFAL